jgi:hypothetical protein
LSSRSSCVSKCLFCDQYTRSRIILCFPEDPVLVLLLHALKRQAKEVAERCLCGKRRQSILVNCRWRLALG